MPRLLLSLLISMVCSVSNGEQIDPANTLWYAEPATQFAQAVPLGNGRMGFMVFGQTDKERIVLNEESMWSGSSFEHNRPGAYIN